MKNYSEITYKYLLHHKKRTILTILGIVLSVALITSIGTIGISYRDKLANEAIQYTGNYYVSFSNVKSADVNKISNNVIVLSSGIQIDEGTCLMSDTSKKDIDAGAPPHRYISITGYDKPGFNMMPVSLKSGRLPKSSNEIAVDYWALNYLNGNPKIGDKIKLYSGIRESKECGGVVDKYSWYTDETFKKTGEKEYTIVGILSPKNFLSNSISANAVTCIDKTDSFKSCNVFVKMASMDNVQGKSQEILKTLSSKPTVKYNNELLRPYFKGINQKVNKGLALAVTFIVLLITVCTIAVIYNTFNISILERISQFGLLRCVGTTPGQIKRIVFKEALILGLIGVPLGLLTGIFAMRIVLYVVGLLKFNMLANVSIVVSPLILVLSSIIGFITIFLSAAFPAMQASRISPMEAVKNSRSVKIEKIKKVKKSNLAKAVFGAEGLFASRNLRRNKKRFRITIFSMVISIVLFIVFGSFINYAFKITGLQSKGSIDYTLYTPDSVNSDSIYKDLRNIAAVQNVYKYYNLSFPLTVPDNKINPVYEKLSGKSIQNKDGKKQIQDVTLLSYGDDNLAELNKNLISGSIDKNSLNKQNGIMLVQTTKASTKDKRSAAIDVTKYNVGDEIQTPEMDKDNSGAKLKVMAILDKGILNEKYNEREGILLITTEEVFKKVTGIKDSSAFLITAKPDVSHTKITNYLSSLKYKNPGYFYNDSAAEAAQNRNDAISVSIFLYGFIGVIILIGCLNIENTISTNIILRTKEFAVLKAVGMTDGAIKKMIILEGVFYGLMAAFYGGVIGTGLYYVLFKILIQVQEVEWVMPWANIIISIIGAIAAALISSILPMKKISSRGIVENLSIDN